jgi:hypothetical protein
VQLSILSGVYSQTGPDFEGSYPLNLVPNFEETGVSSGYLRSAQGIDVFASGVGTDRGGVVWNGTLYRVSGTKFVSVSDTGIVTPIDDVGGSERCKFAISFDRLAINSGDNLYYYNGTTLTQVTDVDLGVVVDVVWMDGYFITTDGTSIVITDLNDPTAVDPLAYGSSEADPDAVQGLGVRRGELIAFNRYTTEFFFDGGNVSDVHPFPFDRNQGAQVDKGIVGTHAKCRFLETYAMCGSGHNEQPQVYLLGEGQAIPISNRGVDRILSRVSEADLADIVLEAREGNGAKELYVHLPDQTLVYSHSGSEKVGKPVWYRLASGIYGDEQYRARNFVLAYDAWHCGDVASADLGVLTDDHDLQFGAVSIWQFDCQLAYSEGKGGICHSLELVGFYGRATPGSEPRTFMSWTDDGVAFSQERSAATGFSGQRGLRVAWRRNGFFRQWRAYRFRGVTGTPVSYSRLEANIEALNG